MSGGQRMKTGKVTANVKVCTGRLSCRVIVLSAALLCGTAFLGSAHASVCCAAKPGSGPRVGAFTGGIPNSGDFLSNPHNDSIETFGMLYGYFGNSWAPDGHTGDPLGTGGKLPFVYALELYREQSVDYPVLTKGDLREQYVDFGYIPTWRANTVAGIGKFRLSPELSANMQMVYGGDPGKPGTNSNGAVGVGEVALTWAPLAQKNIWIKAGNILDGSTFAPIFDQSPLENFLYTGIVASYGAEIGQSIQSVSSISFGGNFINATILKDENVSMPSGSAGFYHASRQRTWLYAKSSLLYDRKFGLKLMGGIQAVPEDSTPKSVTASGSDPYVHFRGGMGGMGGIEATWFSSYQFHTFVVSAAQGDAAIGSFSPDYTLRATDNTPIIVDRSDFAYDPYAYSYSKKGSAVLNLIYWNGIERGAFRLSAGAWYTARLPAATSMQFVNPMSDSLRLSLPDKRMHDSIVTIEAEPFHSFKLSLFPSVQIRQTPLFIGVRYDNITYLTPDAHTNAIEFERDQTLRPPKGSTPNAPRYSPSRWDREAVNANIVAPTVRLDFGEKGGISATYACAFYDKPVDRQGSVARFHQNITLGADLMITYKKQAQLQF